MSARVPMLWIALAGALPGVGLADSVSAAAPAGLAPPPGHSQPAPDGPQPQLERSQPAPPDSLRLPAALGDLQAHAERHNPGLAAARHRWAAARAMEPQERALPDPVLEYGVETRLDSREQSLMLSQTVPWPGKLGAQGQAAAAGARAQRAEYEALRLALRYEVASAFHTHLFIERARSIAAENLALFERVEAVAQARYRAGTGSQTEILRARIEIEKAREDIARRADERAAAAARLNALLDRPADAPLELGDGSVDTRLPRPAALLHAALLADNPELIAAAHRVGQREAGVRRADREYVPDLMLGVRFTDTGREPEPGMSAEPLDPLMVSVGIDLPLWFGRHRALAEQARAERSASLDARQELENRLLAELEQAQLEHREALRRAELYGANLVPLAEQALAVTLRSFATGGAAFVDVIDAQRTLLELRLALELARADRERAAARLEMLAPRGPADGSEVGP